MISNRKFRFVGVAALTIILVVILYKSNAASHAITSPATLDSDIQASKQQTLITSNNLIDSNNDDKLDAAINNEISKLGGDSAPQQDDEAQSEPNSAEPVAADAGIPDAVDTTDDNADVDDGKQQDQLSKPVGADAAKADKSLDFDPAKELSLIRAMAPMVVFSKTYCPYSKKVKKLLKDHYQINPEPAIVELDKHSHGAALQDYLAELTGRKTVPNILVGSTSTESRGGADDFIKLHDEGVLLDLLNKWGNKEIDVKKIEAPSNS